MWSPAVRSAPMQSSRKMIGFSVRPTIRYGGAVWSDVGVFRTVTRALPATSALSRSWMLSPFDAVAACETVPA